MPDPSSAYASFWLMATQDDQALLVQTVEGLAARHATPVFAPHLTLLGDIPQAPAALGAPLRAIAQACAPFACTVADVVSGAAFFRSFYLLMAPAPEFVALRAAAERAFVPSGGTFMPHVSLLYGPVAEPAKAASVAEMRQRWRGRTLRFDRLVLSNSANDVPIPDWREVDSVPLGGV